jgi:hypothetical protein
LIVGTCKEYPQLGQSAIAPAMASGTSSFDPQDEQKNFMMRFEQQTSHPGFPRWPGS